ncbi:MAG: hypothetical protein HYY85_03180 [Deltaproteobacteria bacterium]|nr:hypothetical protein [Deltaproteobacteria bacterium]
MRETPHRMMRWLRGVALEGRHVLKAYGYLPVTFTKRALLGRDPYWRQYFWSRWGVPPPALEREVAGRRTLWIDARSGGEVTQCFTFCRLLRARFPDHLILFSTNSHDALQAARRLPGVDHVFDSPWDLVSVSRRLLGRLRPRALIFIENAPHVSLIREARRAGVRTILCSAFMSRRWEEHPQMARALLRGSQRDLDAIGAKEEVDAEGFRRLGVEASRIRVTGNLKYDIEEIRLMPARRQEVRQEFGFTSGDVVFVAGSLNEGEIRPIIRAYQLAARALGDLVLVLVPRYRQGAATAAAALDAEGMPFVLRSREGPLPRGTRVLVVDTFGELGRLYGVAQAAFLGATLVPLNRLGYGQNVIEPIIQETPTFFGRFCYHWADLTARLRGAWDGLDVRTPEELAEGLVYLHSHPEVVEEIRKVCRQIADENAGAAARTVAFIAELLGA